MKKVRFWAVLAIGFMSVMSLKAQSQRMNEFQNEFSKYQTQYRELMHSGKHKEAMAPLASCIAMLDTTTIFKRNRRDFCTTTMRAAMHWWGKRNRHSRHWSSLFCWATKIIIIW